MRNPEDQVTLRRISMRSYHDFIYSPSTRNPIKRTISHQEFVKEYKGHSAVIQVSFDKDRVSNPLFITAYGWGLDVWWIAY